MITDDEKTRLRTEARAIRSKAFESAEPRVARLIAKHVMDFLGPVDEYVVAGYMAKGSEVDLGPLMRSLVEQGATLALPVVTEPDEALTFRVWAPGDALIKGAYGIYMPDGDSLEVQPEIVLVPLLAFDGDGHRLGQGGGFYDRTLDKLRHDGEVTAIGVAFAAQRVQAIPRADHDQRLDAVLTEDGVLKIELKD